MAGTGRRVMDNNSLRSNKIKIKFHEGVILVAEVHS